MTRRTKVHERVLTERYVEVEVGKNEYLVVQDILDMAKALEDSQVPVNTPVKAQIPQGRDGSVLRQLNLRGLRVDWSSDLTDGEPTPKAMPVPRADKDPSP